MKSCFTPLVYILLLIAVLHASCRADEATTNGVANNSEPKLSLKQSRKHNNMPTITRQPSTIINTRPQLQRPVFTKALYLQDSIALQAPSDKLNTKELYVYLPVDTSLQIQYEVQYYPNTNQIRRTGWITRPVRRRTGNWQMWYANGQLAQQSYYDSSVKNGTWLEWYENGNKKSITHYDNNLQVGDWEIWHANGNKKEEASFKEGLRIGKITMWHPNGKVEVMGNYKNNMRHGAWTTFDTLGQKILEQQYNHGDIVEE